ncbi:MAG: HflC protein [Deltaproteobacteria bacterium]|jgi:membrane protease subunit HflC|nr:HflC protein [Deltaproteobacteria bacterium]
MGRLLILLLLATPLVSSYLGFGPIVLNREGEQKIVLFLGAPRAVITEPGLSFAFPVTEVRSYDRRWLHLSSGEPNSIQTLDKEPLVVDSFAIWRILDPLQFNKSFPTGIEEAERQLNQQVKGRVREVIGRLKLKQVLAREIPDGIDLSTAREAGCLPTATGPDGNELPPTLTAVITARSCQAVANTGIELAEVRLNRTEIPAGDPEAKVYDRMRSERQELAKKYRAEGEEAARKIRAAADRDAKITIERARAEATRIRGEGDAGAAAVYAEAFSEDPEFYEFVRSLEAYQKSLGEGTMMVLPPDHPFLEFLQSGGAKRP